MSELRSILELADENSLILGDELCSGTENDSALSIFVAGLEELNSKKCTYLFAMGFEFLNSSEFFLKLMAATQFQVQFQSMLEVIDIFYLHNINTKLHQFHMKQL